MLCACRSFVTVTVLVTKLHVQAHSDCGLIPVVTRGCRSNEMTVVRWQEVKQYKGHKQKLIKLNDTLEDICFGTFLCLVFKTEKNECLI